MMNNNKKTRHFAWAAMLLLVVMLTSITAWAQNTNPFVALASEPTYSTKGTSVTLRIWFWNYDGDNAHFTSQTYLTIDDTTIASVNLARMWNLFTTVDEKMFANTTNNTYANQTFGTASITNDTTDLGSATLKNLQIKQKTAPGGTNGDGANEKWSTIDLVLEFNTNFSFGSHTIGITGEWLDKTDNDNNKDVTKKPTTTLTGIYSVSVSEGFSLSPEPAKTLNNINYYANDTKITVSYNNSIPEGYAISGTVNGSSITGNTYTVNSTDGDVEIIAAIRSDGHKHSVKYVDAQGLEHTAEAIALDGTETGLTAGWYFVGRDIFYDHTLSLSDDVKLILGDGKKMNMGTADVKINGNGIGGDDDGNLSVYGQSLDEKNVGQLSIFASENGIYCIGDITINGGSVEALGDEAGIYSERGNISLGWTNSTDFIKASSIHLGIDSNSVTIVEGKAFTDEDGNMYSGALTGKQLSAIEGKKLEPCYMVTLDLQKDGAPIMLPATFDENGVAFVKKPDNPTRGGFTFVGWFTDKEGGSEFDFTKAVTENTVVYAKWMENTPVEYVDENGETKSVSDYVLLTNDIYVDNLPGGWYVVEGEVKYTSQVNFEGNAHLILVDGATIEIETAGESEYGILASNNLTIYGQSKQSGILNVTAKGPNSQGIVSNGNITIIGGRVTVTGSSDGIYTDAGDITLGWTNSTDFITASNIYLGADSCSATIVEGKSFVDENGNEYSGKLSSNQVRAIAGKTLVSPSFEGKFLSDVNIAVVDIPVQKYADGKPVCPSVLVTDGKDTLKADTDYMVTCVNNAAVTSATLDEAAVAQIIGKGNYAGVIQKRFFIWNNIHDYAAVQVFQDADGKTHAEIDGAYDGADAVAIDEDVENVAVRFNRKFTPNSGFSTIMLPFDIKAENLTGVRSVIEFAGVADNDGKNAVEMRYVWCNAEQGEQEMNKGNDNCNELSGELKAYTPYMVEMEETTFGINGNVTLKPNFGESVGDARVDDWVFRGALGKKEWSGNENIIKNGRIWGFAGVARKDITIGQFLRFGRNTSVKPFRAYLVDCTGVPDGYDCEEYFENQPERSFASRYRFADGLASSNSVENSLSAKMPAIAASEIASLDGMEVIIVNGDKDRVDERTTVIGRMNPATGEIHMLPRTKQTYDLKGRSVGNDKRAKGSYYRK